MTEETGFEAVKEGFDQFLRTLPQLLERFPDITGNELKLFTNEVNINQQEDLVTLAVTGKIKEGKSTLINALIDRDLPTTGVTEATATINRIKHVGDFDLDTFVVRWKDNNKEDSTHHLDEFGQFIGEEGKGKQHEIEYITLYAEAEFLENILLIDTPGEQGTQLNEIHIKPDALIRAISFEIGANDEKKLKQYSDETRLFGSWPSNTIAITQKWEEHWPANTTTPTTPFEHSPIDPAYECVKWQTERLKNSVAKIIPVSGLLWHFSQNASESLLDTIQKFVQCTSRDDLLTFVIMERRYKIKEVDSSTIQHRENIRKSVISTLGNHGETAAWPVLKMAIWACVFHKVTDANGLRKQLRILSNMDELKEILEVMFFKRTRLLKMQTTLKKALDIAKDADYKLNDHREYLSECISDAGKAICEIELALESKKALVPITIDYLHKSRENLNSEQGRLEDVIRQLQRVMREVENQLSILVTDMEWLQNIESNSLLKNVLEEHIDLNNARSLFGHHGAKVYQRLGFEMQVDKEILIKKLYEELSKWKEKKYASQMIEFSNLVDFAIKRLTALRKDIDNMI